MSKPQLFLGKWRTLGKGLALSTPGHWRAFYPIHQIGADWLNGAEAPLTDRLESDTSVRRRRRERERGLEGRRDMSPPSLTAALWSYNSGPHWVTCQTYPQQLTTVWILNGSSPLLSFYTWCPSVCLLSSSFAVYGYMGILLCPCHTLLRKVTPAQRGGEGVSVLFIA